jgi:hypothetical protein
MPSLSFAIDQLLASLGKSARGSHQARLDAKSLADLERFVTFLVKAEGKGENTARVYKSLCAKALGPGGPDRDNPVMMSALQALRRFRASQ